MSDGVARLLARGGRALGAAAVAHARGARADGGWSVLSPELAAAADAALAALAAGVTPRALAAAIGAAMRDAPATAAPAWTAPFGADPEALARAGRAAAEAWPGHLPAAPGGDRERGLRALALALCRSSEAPRAVAAALAPEDGLALVRLARLYEALARPGEPGAVRAAIRAAVAGEDAHGRGA